MHFGSPLSFEFHDDNFESPLLNYRRDSSLKHTFFWTIVIFDRHFVLSFTNAFWIANLFWISWWQFWIAAFKLSTGFFYTIVRAVWKILWISGLESIEFFGNIILWLYQDDNFFRLNLMFSPSNEYFGSKLTFARFSAFLVFKQVWCFTWTQSFKTIWMIPRSLRRQLLVWILNQPSSLSLVSTRYFRNFLTDNWDESESLFWAGKQKTKLRRASDAQFWKFSRTQSKRELYKQSTVTSCNDFETMFPD